MPAVQTFLANPLAFMRSNIVQQSVAGTGAVHGNTGWFTFSATPSEGRLPAGGECTVYSMQVSNEGTEGVDRFQAYWCPYANDHVYSITLAGEARYMFTAKMDGCSFGVGVPAPDGSVRVAHANSSETEELQAIQNAMAEESLKRKPNLEAINRLGMENLRTKGKEQIGQLRTDEGLGQDAVIQSLVGPLDYKAFSLYSTTFGVRSGTGTWSFYFQAYRQNGLRRELIGCFPLSSRTG
jgi:hypothetical protein